MVAPGVSYSQGSGWEVGIEALIPATRTTGRGVGVIAQLVLQLDYLLPDSVLGRPIFPCTEVTCDEQRPALKPQKQRFKSPEHP